VNSLRTGTTSHSSLCCLEATCRVSDTKETGGRRYTIVEQMHEGNGEMEVSRVKGESETHGEHAAEVRVQSAGRNEAKCLPEASASA
jgi:hypothetical protein